MSSPIECRVFDHYIFITDLGQGLLRYTFNGSYNNIPAIVNPVLSLPSLFGIDVVYDCNLNSYFAITASAGSGGIGIYDFGNDLSSNPVALPLINMSSAPRGLSVVKENNEYFVATTNANNYFTLQSFGNSLYNTPTVVFDSDFGGSSLSASFSCHLIKDKSMWHCFATNVNSSLLLSHFVFPDNCTLTAHSSSEQEPTTLIYPVGTTGFQLIELTVTDSDYNQTQYVDSVYITIPPAVAAFTHGPTCVNTSVSFTDNSTLCYGNITGWKWDFGDNNSSNLQNTSHTYASAGSFLATLTVYTSNGDSSITGDSIYIVPFPVANFSFTGNVCTKVPVQFTDLSNAPGDSITAWTWDFNDSTTSSDQNPIHPFETGGLYNVQLIAYNSNGCSDTNSQSITILPSPIPQFTAVHTCINEGTEFNNLTDSAGLPSVTYTWNFGDTQSSNAISPVHIYNALSTYSVTLVTTGSNSCIDSINYQVTVNNKPTPAFTIAPTLACTGNNVNFTDLSTSGSPIVYRRWEFGDNTIDSTTIANHVYAIAGTYNVNLTVATSSFCDTTITQTISVVQSPVVAFTVTNSCFGTPVDFTNQTIPATGDPVATYQWNFGDTTFSNAFDTVHNYAVTGTYNVTLIATSQAGCIDSLSLPASSFANPVADFTNYPLLCTDTAAVFVDLSTIVGDTISDWYWDFGDGLTDTLQSPSHEYTTAGVKLVTLTVTSINGCSNSISHIITIHPAPSPAFTYSATCLGATTCFTASDINNPPNIIDTWQWNFGDSTLSLVQNPCHKYNLSGTVNAVLQVTDTNGCHTSITSPVIIHPVPQSGFMHSQLCTDQNMLFTDTSTIVTGSITGWEWKFNGIAGGNTPQTNYTTSSTGLLPASLIVTSDFGCTDTILNYVLVNQSPNAQFSISPVFSAPQEIVTFSNQSTNANTYTWIYGDGSTNGSGLNTTHSYQDTGFYTVYMIALNNNGCADTISRNHSVVIPNVDIAVMDVSKSESNGLLSVKATLYNASNVDINTFEIIAEVEGVNPVHEFPLFYLPAASSPKLYTFQSNIQLGSEAPGFVCVEARYPNGLVEANTSNNRKCNSSGTALELLSMMPNPAGNTASLAVNMPSKGSPELKIIDAIGNIVLQQTLPELAKGFNSISLDLTTVSNGAYSLIIEFNDEDKVMRFVKL